MRHKQQDQSGVLDRHGTWRGHLRIVLGEPCLSLSKHLRWNDGGEIDLYYRGGIVQATGSRISTSIGPFTGRIAAIPKDAVDRADSEAGAAARTIPMLIEPFGGFLDAEGPRTPVTVGVKAEDKVDELGFDGINIESLFDLRAAPLGFNNPVTEGRRCTIPESLLCGLTHGAGDILAVFTRGVLVENPDDLPHELLRRVVAGGLGDGDHLNAVLAELSDGQLHLCTIAIEARKGMDADNVEAAI